MQMTSVFSAYLMLIIVLASSPGLRAEPASGSGPVREVTIRASRDMGYFAGDLVRANAQLVVDDGWEVETASLPRPGPVNYWLDLRSIDIDTKALGGGRQRFSLRFLYQDFYDALDARQQEIPTFQVVFRKGTLSRTAFVPAWTIGVSPLREVAPPLKEDPRDYMRADEHVEPTRSKSLWLAAGAALLAALLTLVLWAYDRAIWPFQARPTRAFGGALRAIKRLSRHSDTDERYLAALLAVHRGMDGIDGRIVHSDDLSAFLQRHPHFSASAEPLTRFYAASRHAFFESSPSRSRANMPFHAIERLAKRLAAMERQR